MLNTISKFSDLYELTKKIESNKEKGNLFEQFTYYLFKLDPRLNNLLQNIWLYNDIPSDIKKKLKLPDKDKGIDALAEIDDEYYAIQCKFRQNPSIVVSWSELSTFFGLSFGINDKIKKGYLVTNTYDICDEVNKSEKVIVINGNFLDELDSEFFKMSTIEEKNM